MKSNFQVKLKLNACFVCRTGDCCLVGIVTLTEAKTFINATLLSLRTLVGNNGIRFLLSGELPPQ